MQEEDKSKEEIKLPSRKENQETIGDRIRELRKNKGLTQTKFGELLFNKEGVTSQIAMSRLENGEIEITAADLVKIADFFGVSLDYLARGEDVSNEIKNFIIPVSIENSAITAFNKEFLEKIIDKDIQNPMLGQVSNIYLPYPNIPDWFRGMALINIDITLNRTYEIKEYMLYAIRNEINKKVYAAFLSKEEKEGQITIYRLNAPDNEKEEFKKIGKLNLRIETILGQIIFMGFYRNLSD